MSLPLVFLLLVLMVIFSQVLADTIVEMTGRIRRYSTGHLGVFMVVFGLTLFLTTALSAIFTGGF